MRVAACTPRIHVGDPASNADETLALMRIGEKRRVDLMLFPELGLSAYAIDDLLLQEALLDAVEVGIGKLVAASRRMRQVCIVGAPVRRNQRLYNCGVVFMRGRILGIVPKSFLPNYREYYENRWFSPGADVAGLEAALAGAIRALRRRSHFRGDRPRGLHLPRGDLRGLLDADAAFDARRPSPGR